MTGKEDLYILLDVGRTASLKEIKRAFRRLARRYHPDINPGDHQAEDLFKRITEAYEILSNPTKRQFYDLNGFYSDGVLEEQSADQTGSSVSEVSIFPIRAIPIWRYFRPPFRSRLEWQTRSGKGRRFRASGFGQLRRIDTGPENKITVFRERECGVL